MSSKVLIIEKLTKRFNPGLGMKSINAINNISFDMEEGKTYGLLGHNGAGKTTLFKIILGLIKPDSGSVKLWNCDISSRKKRKFNESIGFMPESPYFYPYLSAYEVLNFYGSFFYKSKKIKQDKIDFLLNLVGLYDSRNQLLRNFSRGMLQRIGIAQALINDPLFLILDEPMSGLDPAGRSDMRNIILDCKKEGKTVLFSSHILSDAEIVCDFAAILNKGNLLKMINIKDIFQKKVKSWEITAKIMPELIQKFNDNSRCTIKTTGDYMILDFTDEDAARMFVRSYEKNGGKIISFIPRRESLEEIYVKESKIFT